MSEEEVKEKVSDIINEIATAMIMAKELRDAHKGEELGRLMAIVVTQLQLVSGFAYSEILVAIKRVLISNEDKR